MTAILKFYFNELFVEEKKKPKKKNQEFVLTMTSDTSSRMQNKWAKPNNQHAHFYQGHAFSYIYCISIQRWGQP